MESARSERSPSSSDYGAGLRTRSLSPYQPPPDYGSAAVQDALEQLASTDLLELCNEAKVERCRATRDLSSCGRYVQHVLNSCGHASLCEECSKRCDACPICRKLITNANDGSRLSLRLYYKCIEAGLISKEHDDRSQEREVSREYVFDDIQRLYSLFDVALGNNLASLVCHYVTDVCMNENAVSSDPVFAFLLDEVVVKDWCKSTFKHIVFNLRDIYSQGSEAVNMMQKFALHLSGLSNVLEVMALSLRQTFAAQLTDLHLLLENVVKTKQHLEVMIWCARHRFLRDVQSRFSGSGNSKAWSLDVLERKEAAIKRSWPESSIALVGSARKHDNTLFIEDALSNLAIEENYVQKQEELDISCLQDDNSPVLFLSKIDRASGNGCYPFQNLRAAADLLFLRGASNMVLAKQAIFLYYLFDRHWTKPDTEWKCIVDDFALFFGISMHSVVESMVFYLLDNHTPQALQEAVHLLPEIAGPQTHPKIAQVLLERGCPDVALSTLRCSGRDGCYNNTNLEKDYLQDDLVGEAVTVVRVRIECGLLTEAFMCLRMYYSKAKEMSLKHVPNLRFSNPSNTEFWVYLSEVLVTEICHLCNRRNLIDRMIELPWNSDEEKHLHKCLFDYASQDPSSTCGSLLVVFYLQRHRFTEAYQVNCGLEKIEQTFLESASEEVGSRIRLICQWRAGLVDKSLSLLPEVERQKILTGDITDLGHFSSEAVKFPLVADLSNEKPNPTSLINSSMRTSVIRSKKSNPLSGSPVHNDDSESASMLPSVLQRKLLASFESTSADANAVGTDGLSSSFPLTDGNPFSNGGNLRNMMQKTEFSRQSLKLHHSSKAKPVKDLNSSATRVLKSEYHFHSESSFDVQPVDFPGQAANMEPSLGVTLADHNRNGFPNGSVQDLIESSGNFNIPNGPLINLEKVHEYPLEFRKGETPEDNSFTVGGRWRSDESSEDEEDIELAKYTIGSASSTRRRRPRLSRR
ncbi:E3 ubiquitin-protein ligase HOS1 [Zingiber officinale]|uniref:E3 ubiquitin-protein ligase HOS1 n=1 Tax=Zingiber officinale TaxID=94328 RepID=UPI001C4B7EBB|nr:E3 ubiquitin-protein ligase HOS1 [Zingiber officinale]